jgi:drug/metabolite transporter (DMT)-like permease
VSRFGLSMALKLPDIAALRFGIAGLLLSPILFRHGFSGLRPLQVIVLAALGGLGFALFAYAGFLLAPAAHGAILLHGTLSLTTAVLLWAFGLGAVRAGQGAGLIAIGLGIAAMTWDGFAHSSIRLLIGDLCLLLASLSWSGYGIYVKRLGLAAIRASAIVAVISALIFLPFYAILPGKMLLQANWRDLVLQAGFQGVLIGTVSIFIYTRAVALLGATEVSFFTAAVPGITTLGGYVLLGETPSFATLAGVSLVSLGMLIALRTALRGR